MPARANPPPHPVTKPAAVITTSYNKPTNNAMTNNAAMVNQKKLNAVPMMARANPAPVAKLTAAPQKTQASSKQQTNTAATNNSHITTQQKLAAQGTMPHPNRVPAQEPPVPARSRTVIRPSSGTTTTLATWVSLPKKLQGDDRLVVGLHIE